jgi:integral membrane protein
LAQRLFLSRFKNENTRVMLKTPVGRLRAVGMMEAVSFLVLLGIAMPLKYFADLPQAVRVVGWVHGILFIGFFIALMSARDALQWNVRWTALVLLAGLLPFGPFVIDGRLRKKEKVYRAESAS